MKIIFIFSFLLFSFKIFALKDYYYFALETQRKLNAHLPLNHGQFLFAHNSWNNGLNAWSNQRWSLKKMLKRGIRGFDLDLHSYKGKVVLCHDKCGKIYSARDSYHDEINYLADWLKSHPNEILFIDFEMKTGDKKGVLNPLKKFFGELIYLPSDKPKNRWPTPNEMIELRKRVIIKSVNNTFGGKIIWHGRHFATHARGGYNAREVKDFSTSNCQLLGHPIKSNLIYSVFDSKLGKALLPDKWVDQTGTISDRNIQRIMNCGVNIIDADRWNKSMLKSTIWTWAKKEPNNEGGNQNCAVIWKGHEGRWDDQNCEVYNHYACQHEKKLYQWKVTQEKGPWIDGTEACEREFGEKFKFSTPLNAKQNKIVFDRSPTSTIWLNYSDRDQEGEWTFGPQ